MRFKQSNELCTVNFPNSLVIFNLRNYRSLILNDNGSLIWDFCKKPKNLNQIARFLNAKYKIGLSKSLRDTKRFIHQLEKRGLLIYR